ncbi:MAG TPA: hypothetical protein VFX19_00945 [Dehalococcoidia bacterium]|jgi:hypothetical protein|nr:hypothetical protein [Dehalococcoidia bacterium]
MTMRVVSAQVVADVKCYFCGHISGQIVSRRGEPLRVTNFIPRPGYQGPEVKPGTKLRCERCNGPVFLEDATNSSELARTSLKLRLAARAAAEKAKREKAA